jgi:1-acyl-sn-glycerol-3-phosphate acyltransferase
MLFPYFPSVFYSLFKIYARLAIKFYCKRIIINKPEVLKSKGPLLLAASHPNSFLDGMIVTTLFDHPVHSLARGDVFKNKRVNKFLRKIQLLPVYRTSEGVENLEHNYTTFAACQDTFLNNGIVLIFSEGRCENEWHLRPLKKGTARLALSSWQKGIPLKVIPLAINYSSFKNFGKEVHLFFGEIITSDAINLAAPHGRQLLDFNTLLNAQLQQYVYEIDEKDKAKAKKIFSIKKDASFYPLLLPAAVGFVLHAPLYYVCKGLTEIRFRHSGHYDSVMTTLLIVSYPFYWLIFVLIAYTFQPLWVVIFFLIMPFTAWAAVQVKYQLDHVFEP